MCLMNRWSVASTSDELASSAPGQNIGCRDRKRLTTSSENLDSGLDSSAVS